MKIAFGNPVTYILEDAAGLVLEAGALNRANGGEIRIWRPSGGEAQQWRFEPAAGGCYRIRNVFSGKLLDVAMQGTENGTGIHQWEDTGADSQLWSIILHTPGSNISASRYDICEEKPVYNYEEVIYCG